MSGEAYIESDVEAVMRICSNVERTDALIGWMDALVGECVDNQAGLVDTYDEAVSRKLQCLCDKISAFRRIRDAARRALEVSDGQPPGGEDTETADGGVL